MFISVECPRQQNAEEHYCVLALGIPEGKLRKQFLFTCFVFQSDNTSSYFWSCKLSIIQDSP